MAQKLEDWLDTEVEELCKLPVGDLSNTFFFRDPMRPNYIDYQHFYSPADGVILYQKIIEDVKDPIVEIKGRNYTLPEVIGDKNYNKPSLVIGIFMTFYDVHINRIPSKGKITSIKYIEGKFLSATLDKSSDKNERNIISMEVKNKNKLIFVQIAGLIARRIVSNLDLNQKVNLGDRFGLIKFGSRVDLYIPKNIKLNVYKGQKVKGGETIFGDLENNLDTMGIEKK